MKLFSFSFFLVFISINLVAQKPSSYCGTSVETQAFMIEQSRKTSKVITDSRAPIFIPMQVHSVGSDAGGGHFRLHYIYDALCNLNKDYAPSGIQFFLENDINYINSSSWNTHEYDAGEEMMRKNNKANVANSYIVADPAGNCGYFSPRGNAVALAKSCIGDGDHTWAHEMGHFFSLPHTFFGWEGIRYDQSKTINEWQRQVFTTIEQKQRANCNNQADGYCDTPPDYLSYRWECDRSNNSIVLHKDVNDSTFYADGSLFMSYSNDHCSSRFAEDQMEGMRQNIAGSRSNLIRNNVIPVYISNLNYNNILPVDSGNIKGKNVTLTWDPIPGASRYIIDIARNTSFGLYPQQFITSDNFVKIDSLNAGTRYFWKVRAVNNYDFCGAKTKTLTFKTETITATNNFESSTLNVYPNPIQQNELLMISYERNSDIKKISISNLNNQTIIEQEITDSNSEFTKLDVKKLLPGIYKLNIHSSTSLISKKIIVQ
jgi:hypothetical protein